MAAGSITNAIEQARFHAPGFPVETEVENLAQLEEAIEAKADRVLLDNFNLDNIREAVKLTDKKIPLEVSGNVTLDTVREIAKTGVDFISTGDLTKDVIAIDLSMRFSM